MLGRVAQVVLGHRLWVVVGVLVVLGVSIAGALRLRLDFSSTSFYGSQKGEVTQNLETFVQRWGSDDRMLLVLAEAPKGTVLSAKRLRALQALAEELRAVPSATEVTALPGLQPPGGGPSIMEAFEQLEGSSMLPGVRRSLLDDPRLVPLILSQDGSATAVVVELASSTDDLGATVQTVQAYEAIVEEHRARSDLHLRLAGVPAIRAAFFGLTLRDQMIFSALTAVLIGVTMFAVFRRRYAVLAALAAAGLPVVMLVGLMGWLGEPVGLLNQAYFTLIPVIAVADTIHLLVRLHLEGKSRSRRDAIVTAMDKVGHACLLTTATTALGFGSLAISDAAVLRHFGLYAAAGLVLSYLTLLVVVPVVLASTKEPLAEPPTPSSFGQRMLERLAAQVKRRPFVLIGAVLVVATTAALGAPRVIVDNRLTDLLEPEHPVHQASQRVDDALGGVLSLEIDLDAPPRWWNSAAGRDFVEALLDWGQAQPEVRAALGPATPGRSEAFVNEETGAARVSLRTGDIGGKAFVALAQRTRAELDRLAPRSVEARVTGTTLVAYRGVNLLTEALRDSLLLIFAVVTATVLLLTRSLRLTLASIPTNVIPLVVAYGTIGWIGMLLDPLATVVLTVALGIAVDDTIHFLHRYQEARSAGSDSSEAIHTAMVRTGRALSVTSAVLAAGLAINAFSSFPPLQVLGVMGASVILLALLADLTLLPALLMVTSPKRPKPDDDAPRGPIGHGGSPRARPDLTVESSVE